MLDFNMKKTQRDYETPLVEFVRWTEDVLSAKGSTDVGGEYPEDMWG